MSAALGCSSARPPLPPAMPEDRIAFIAHDSLRPLAQIPYDQPFAWVEPSRMFKGLYERDDQPALAADLSGLRKSILVPLEALGWYEVPESEARYLVAALVAERVVLESGNLQVDPTARGQTGRRRPLPRPGELDRPRSGNQLPVGRVYRGWAVMSKTGEVHLRVFTGDRYTAESAVGADVIEKVMGSVP